MEALKNKILSAGQVVGTDIVKVDSFLNHQIDAKFMYDIGEEFKKRFSGVDVNRILTIEASGIAIAVCTAFFFGYPPVVFAKKSFPSTMTEEFYSYEAKSFTRGTSSLVVIAKKFLHENDNVLILDDFLAHGEAAYALSELVIQAKAKVAGIGTVIEKAFQGGGDRLRGEGYRVESLAVIEKIEDGRILFKQPDKK
jgi:xanthine phosphoribosyltransferase